jgi:molybdopterin-guanine dinucleotide biosynthesis protein A
MPTAAFDAVVLTGGRGSRLGGAVKADVVVAGATLLERARWAVAAAGSTVEVGSEVQGGPVAAIEAGLGGVDADVVVLLACDMPLVSAQTVMRLVDGLADASDADGALLTDEDDRRQYLAGAYRTARLRDAVRSLGPTADRSMRRLVSGLRLRGVPAQPEEAMDCDTWPDVARATELLEGR